MQTGLRGLSAIKQGWLPGAWDICRDADPGSLPGGQRERRPLGRQTRAALTGQLKDRQGSEGAAGCFVLIMSEMLTWASPGMTRGRPAPPAVEVFLQTVRKAQVSRRGRGAGGREREHSLCQGRAPRWPFGPSLATPEPGPSHPALPFPSRGPRAQGPAGALLGASEQLEVVGHSKTLSASFPWVPWAALGGPGNCSPYLF